MKRFLVISLGVLALLPFLSSATGTQGAAATVAPVQSSIVVQDLTVEGLVNPEGLDVLQPRFSWKTQADGLQEVVQTDYQIVVASSAEKLERGEYDLWNSGRVKSREQLWIAYQGKALRSKQVAWWKVKVWTNKGESAFSQPAFWSMGLLADTDWRAQWIGLDRAMPHDSETQWSRLSARYLRKEFKAAKTVKTARVYIAGLGLYELFINGLRVGDQVLAPAPTDYRKSVLYNTYDVTSHLRQGANALGVVLGNGRYYTMRQNYKPYKINTFGYPKLRLNLSITYTDGSAEEVVSNASWKLNADGPIRSNNEYDGEIYDARKELGSWTTPGYDDSRWMPAERVSIPVGKMKAQKMPGMKITQRIFPLTVTHLPSTTNHSPLTTIFDYGQNLTGWVRIKVRGLAGDTVRLRFSEILQEDGSLYTRNLRDALATDYYILKGDEQGETWAPVFVYHGFRYMEISGLRYQPDKNDCVAEMVEDEMRHTGNITTSNEVLNKVLQNASWGIRGNYKGMPVDCPQRNERQPWLGDRTMGSRGESFLFDNKALYAKWMDDIAEAQRYDGAIPDVAPAYWNYYSDNVTWPAAFPMTLDMLYRQFGDMQPIRTHYRALETWMRHIARNYMTADYIVTRDEYGDWCVPPESPELIHSRDPRRKTDGALLSTAYYYQLSGMMARFAALQGFSSEEKEWKSMAAKVKEGFNSTFLRRDSLFYGNNSATSNLLPLAFGMVPAELTDTIGKQILSKLITGYDVAISTGVVGTQWMMKELRKMGRGDVAFAIASSSKYPSWGYMAAKGATTIWELWNGDTADPSMNSGNHVMLLGDLLPWVFEDLAGIASDRDAPAYQHLTMGPDFTVPDLEFVDASYETPYGKVVSKWKKNLMKVEWTVELPVNTTADIYLPDGIKRRIGSGKYTFSVTIPQQKGVVVQEYIYEKSGFPQCHSATIAQTTEGDLLTAFFGGTREGHPDVCIYVSRKEKGSEEWTKPELVADGWMTVEGKAVRKACYNPVLFQQPGGALYLFYKVGNRVSDWKGFLKMSRDGGRSWSRAFNLPEGYLGPVKNKIEIVDGKAIAPSSTETNGWKVHFEISEDNGRKYRKVGPLEAEAALPTHLQSPYTHRIGQTTKGTVSKKSITPGNTVSTGNPLSNQVSISQTLVSDAEGGDNAETHVIQAIQPSILKHRDGRLQILCRTRNGRLATAWSTDRGETWSALSLTDMPNNNSGTDAVTLADGRHLLVYNAVATPPGQKKAARTPLNVAVSTNGLNWKPLLTLETSPVSQYSYPSVIQTPDGYVHIVYTWRRERVKYVKLKIE
jgi:alpha-L-rhamnosidase